MSTHKVSLFLGILTGVFFTSSNANALDAGQALAQSSGCFACHQVATKVVGPSYKDVANKYRSDATAQAKLVAKVKKGGSGTWGAVAMPAQTQVSDANLNAIVKWILTIK